MMQEWVLFRGVEGEVEGVCLVPHATLIKRECTDLHGCSYSIGAVILSYSH